MTDWRTTIPGVISLIMGMLVVYFSAVVIPKEAIEPEIRTVLVMIGIGIMGGGGLVAARSTAASHQAVKDIDQKIAQTQQAGAQDHAENVAKIQQVEQKVETVKEAAIEEAAVVAERKVTEELRRGP